MPVSDPASVANETAATLDVKVFVWISAVTIYSQREHSMPGLADTASQS